MATPGSPIPPGAMIGDLTGRQQQLPTEQIGKGSPIPQTATIGDLKDAEPTDHDDKARKVGYYINDVGNQVIVPKEGEAFEDTMRRAAQHGKLLVDHEGNLTAQGERELNAEEATIPAKAGASLGAAATIGVAGPAVMAAPIELHAALAKGYAALVPALTEGVSALGEWASQHPVAAKAVYEGIKLALQGTALYKGAKAVRGVIDAAD